MPHRARVGPRRARTAATETWWGATAYAALYKRTLARAHTLVTVSRGTLGLSGGRKAKVARETREHSRFTVPGRPGLHTTNMILVSGLWKYVLCGSSMACLSCYFSPVRRVSIRSIRCILFAARDRGNLPGVGRLFSRLRIVNSRGEHEGSWN